MLPFRVSECNERVEGSFFSYTDPSTHFLPTGRQAFGRDDRRERIPASVIL